MPSKSAIFAIKVGRVAKYCWGLGDTRFLLKNETPSDQTLAGLFLIFLSKQDQRRRDLYFKTLSDFEASRRLS